jgi:hypothetical protein
MPELYYCHDSSMKKTNQKNLVQMVGSKSTFPKWGVFLTEIPGHKRHDFLYSTYPPTHVHIYILPTHPLAYLLTSPTTHLL